MASRSIAQIFARFEPKGEIAEIMTRSVIVDMGMSREGREIEITAHFDTVVPYAALQKYAAGAAKTYRLNAVKIFPSYDSGLFNEKGFFEIVEELKKTVSTINGFFNESSCKIDEDKLRIMLKNGGAVILKDSRCDSEIARLVSAQYGLHLHV